MVKFSMSTKSGPATNWVRWALSLLCVLAFVVHLHTIETPSETNRRTKSVSSTADGFALASEQSFGFFDDIPDGQWRQRQRRARGHKHQVDPTHKEVTAKNNGDMYYLQNYYPLFTCPNQERVGGTGDGPKWVCDPLRLGNIHETRDKKGKCLVYSVGCNGNYVFEDGLVDLLGAGACEVHVFDVNPRFGRSGDNTTKDIHFHGWGLKSSYSDEINVSPNWDLLTLQQTIERLGHVGRTIDVFKIDCEGCEWTTYKDWISDSVDIRQILIETHGVRNDPNVKTSDFFDDIERSGFAMFSKEPNIHPHAKVCIEWSFVKLQKDFFANTVKA